MKHVSGPIAADLSKLHPDHAREIRRVANADTASTSIKGVDAREPARDMSKKVVSETVITNRPSPIAPSRAKKGRPQ
jgi:hypothetical protein